jgi:predicted RNA-binding Zn-ribbon protein involved in translation (DUF1610 family)
MRSLPVLIKKSPDEFRLPDDHEVHCTLCGWKGPIKDCSVVIESEGWEYPEYEALVCPACEETDIYI